MIPKVIHYCWFGRGEMPKLAVDCIASWKKYCPDFELMLWNEDSFDLTSNSFTFEAYSRKKYAFITDYVRLYAIYHFGGVYMDTDVELLKGIDDLMYLKAFSGFESETEIPTGIIAGEKQSEWARIQLQYYENKHFILPDGSLDTTTNVKIISDIMRNGGFLFNNTLQTYQDMITIFPKDYFCPKSYLTNKIELTENTYCIHHFASSWLSPKMKFKKKIIQILGPRLVTMFSKIKSYVLKNIETRS